LAATSAVFDVPCEVPEASCAAAASLLPDADHPRSWLGRRLGSTSEYLNRRFGHRGFLHSLTALMLITVVLGAPLWPITGSPATAVAVFVGFGSHLFADTMTLGGVRLFWPHRGIAVFPGRDEYRVVTGSGSETVFLVVVLVLAVLFFFVSRTGFDGLLYHLGGADQVYGRVTKVTDGDTVSVEVYGQIRPVRLIGVDTPETVAPGQPIGCYGKEASTYTKKTLAKKLVRLEIPRIGASEDAYGRTLAYVYLDPDEDGTYEHLFNEDLIVFGLARTTTFSHTYRRRFERLRQEAEERGTGLWSACPDVTSY
jgi:endonuclease YncB( thermonuclease family)